MKTKKDPDSFFIYLHNITASKNKGYDDKYCTVNIKGGDEIEINTIKQGEKLGLLVAKDKLEINKEERTIVVELKTNIDYKTTKNYINNFKKNSNHEIVL